MRCALAKLLPARIIGQSRSETVNGGIITSDQSIKTCACRFQRRLSFLMGCSPIGFPYMFRPECSAIGVYVHCHSGWRFHFSPASTEMAERNSRYESTAGFCAGAPRTQDGDVFPALQPCRNGNCFVVQADEKLTVFVELEVAIRSGG
jgi:hypothetical protein